MGSAMSDAPQSQLLVPALEAVDVVKRYGPVRALDGANLSIARGEWVALVGRSGSGKSTLLNLFAGLDVPTEGVVRHDGIDLRGFHDLDGYRRNVVGLVFQLHNLLPHLDAARNVEIAMLGTHRSRAASRIRSHELLDEVHLGDKAARRPPELSGGERQRLALARALANEPAILLADEPTGSLDTEGVVETLDLIEALRRQHGTTVVMVTHDPDAAAAADRVVTVARGRVLAGSDQATPV
jgi:putative ABC transport system ATP-binding protein